MQYCKKKKLKNKRNGRVNRCQPEMKNKCEQSTHHKPTSIDELLAIYKENDRELTGLSVRRKKRGEGWWGWNLIY